MTGSESNRSDEHPFFDEMLEQILAAPPPPERPRFRRRYVPARRFFRPLPLAGAGMAVAVALAALFIALGASGSDPAPAYAVTVNSNNTVTIYLSQFRALRKLNARLTDLHTRIRAVPMVQGCFAPVHVEIGAYRAYTMHGKPGPAPGPPRTLEVDHIFHVPSAQTRGLYMTVALGTLPGRTLILPVTRSGMLGNLGGVGDGVVVGQAPRCVGDSGLHAQSPRGSLTTGAPTLP
jgi:hypothetical protein